jgi:hypothetical protein
LTEIALTPWPLANAQKSILGRLVPIAILPLRDFLPQPRMASGRLAGEYAVCYTSALSRLRTRI